LPLPLSLSTHTHTHIHTHTHACTHTHSWVYPGELSLIQPVLCGLLASPIQPQ
jgi:hypothetical protein